MRKEKILELARGYWGKSKNCNAIARERVEKGLVYQFRDRKNKRRDLRSLWIQQVNAGSRDLDVPYSRLIHGLNEAQVKVDRKILSNLAINEPLSFRALVEIAKLF